MAALLVGLAVLVMAALTMPEGKRHLFAMRDASGT
jgi:hypothetical protein